MERRDGGSAAAALPRSILRAFRRRCSGALLLLIAGQAAAAEAVPVPPSSADRDVASIRRQVVSGERSCVEVIGDYAARAAARDESLHSIIALNPRARAQARHLDGLVRARKESMPLLCAPLLVKDNIDVAGMATTAGSVALARNRASRDARVVEELRRAGAIVLAKTNMSEFAFNYRGMSSIRGQTRSPLSFEESAGGSSSGNAAALAAGLGVIALGTDTSGSVRVPAALTGIIGLRTTYGLLSVEGVLPLSPSQDVVGPMCRFVQDCVAMLAVLLAPESGAAGSAGNPGALRVGVLGELLQTGLGGELIRQAVDQLALSGAAVTELRLADQEVLVGARAPAGETALFASRSAFDFPDVMDTYLARRPAVPHSTTGLLATLQRLASTGKTDPKVVEDVGKFLGNRAGAANDARYRVNGAFRDEFVRERIDAPYSCRVGDPCVDVLVYSTVRDLAAPVGSGPDTGGTHRLAAYSGRPALAFPIGTVATAAGPRPVAVEIMGRPGSDRQLLAIAAAWQLALAVVK